MDYKNTCYPAQIVSFDPEDQTATVELVIEQHYKNIDTDDYVELPNKKIHKVPVQFPYGSGYVITMPVKTGDWCMVYFAQQGIDHWSLHGKKKVGILNGKPAPQHRRKGNLTDAVCIVGFNPKPNVVENFNPEHLEIRNPENNVVIQLTEDSLNIKVEKDVTIDVKGKSTLTCPTTDVKGDVNIDGELNVTGWIKSDTDVGTPAVASQNNHVHTGNLGSPTSVPTG